MADYKKCKLCGARLGEYVKTRDKLIPLAEAHANSIVKSDVWGDEELCARWNQVYHAEMNNLWAGEAKRLRGET